MTEKLLLSSAYSGTDACPVNNEEAFAYVNCISRCEKKKLKKGVKRIKVILIIMSTSWEGIKLFIRVGNHLCSSNDIKFYRTFRGKCSNCSASEKCCYIFPVRRSNKFNKELCGKV